MKPAFFVVASVLAIAIAGCREPNVAGQCEKPPTCLTGLECTYDSAKNCQSCRCKAPFGATPQTLPPTPPPAP